MIIEKNELIETSYCRYFREFVIIDDIQRLILNSIKIYGLESAGIVAEVEFYIWNINGIVSIYPTRYYESFLLIATRIVNAKIILTKAEDYISNTES